MYNKLFTKILDSSIWLAPDPHRLVWITLISAMDENGYAAFACAENLANRARVAVDDTKAAIAAFERPDPFGPDQEFEGRRIERIDGGWFVLNAEKYRNLVTRAVANEKARLRMQKHRLGKIAVTQQLRSVTPSVSGSVSVSVSVSDQNTTAAPSFDFDELRSIYPKRAGSQPWNRALKACTARIKAGDNWPEMVDGARRYRDFCQATGKIGTEYVMQAATFFGPDRRFAEPWTLPASKADVRLQGNLDAAAEFMRRTEPTSAAN
jgi:hypothetical protein